MKTDHRERQLLAILDDAYALPSVERAAFIRSRLADDPELRSRALKLLAADDGELVTGGALQGLGGADAPPARIGPWRLGDVIGVGGMGSVYRAERDDGAFEQTVAVKLAKYDNTKLAERLSVELATLARLNHPNIAQVFDGGIADGRPYLVMELVEGRPLHQALSSLEIEARLELMGDVLKAVAYAHSLGVGHRDISPANVLVRPDGVTKLIDFGIAQALGSDANQPSGGRTIGFTAPERADGSAGNVVAEDVYSLGRLLHYLTDDGRLPRPYDLVAITAKASAHDPGDRYGGAEAMADDLRRYRQGLPVSVRTGPMIAATRFTQRHPFGTIASGLAAFALIGGTVIASLLAVQARQAEAEAVARFDDMRALSRTVMTDVYEALEQVPGSQDVQRSVLEIVAGYTRQLESDPRAQGDLRLDLAEAHLHLAWLGSDAVADIMSSSDDAEDFYRRAAGALAQIDTTEVGEERLIAARLWADLWWGQHLAYTSFDTEAATAVFDAGASAAEAALDTYPDDPDLWNRYLSLAMGRAEMRFRTNDPAAISSYRDVIDIAERAQPVIPDSRPYDDQNAAYRQIMTLHIRAEAYDRAAMALKKAIQANEDSAKSTLPRRTNQLRNRARTAYAAASLARVREAPPVEVIDQYEAAIAEYERWGLIDPLSSEAADMVPILRSEMAVAYARIGRRKAAIAALTPQLEIDRAFHGEDPTRPIAIEYLIFSEDTVIDVYEALGDDAAACSAAARVRDLGGSFVPPAAPGAAVADLITQAEDTLARC